MTKHSMQALIHLYDKYGAMLYGIALENAPTDKAAAQVLITTFEKAQEQNILENNGHCICATLIKLTIATAHQTVGEQPKDNNSLNLLPTKPLLHKVLFENKSSIQTSGETDLTHEAIGKMIREELNSIRDAKKQTAVGQLQQAARES
jgi:hypothetical protein